MPRCLRHKQRLASLASLAALLYFLIPRARESCSFAAVAEDVQGKRLFLRRVPDGFDEFVTFDTGSVAEELAQRAALALDAEVVQQLSTGDFGGLVCLDNILGPRLSDQLHQEAKVLRKILQPSTYWNRWQEGREDSYRLIDRSSCELHGFRGMATGIDLLLAVCSRLAEICPVDGKRVGPTPHAQLACFAEGSAGYAAHTDGSSMAELDVDMPLDQKQMISSRRFTAILYLNEREWEESYAGAFRAFRSKDMSGGDSGFVDVWPRGGSLVLFRCRDLAHQVLASQHDRYALTMWFTAPAVALFPLSLAAMAWGHRGSMRTTGRSRTIFAAFLAACGIFAHWRCSFVNAWTARPGSSPARGGHPARAAGAAEVAKDGQIFVSIAAYADPELPATMQSLVAAASRPELIRFGIVWQGPGSGLEPLDMDELAKLWNLSSYAEDRVAEHLELPDDASLPIWASDSGDGRRVPLSLRIGGRGWGRGLASEGAGWHSEGHGWDRGRLLGRRVVYFGERHEEPAVCAAQLAALQEWLEANPATPTALVLEHFTAQQQHILDRWGQDDPRELVDEYEAQNGEFDIGLYEPLLTAAAEAKVQLVAGFPSRAEAIEAVRGSMDVREMEELHKLMGPETLEDHFRLFAAMIAGAPVSEHETGEVPTRGRQIFLAQCWKDFVCAKVIVGLLGSHHTMVVCGCGHLDFGLGIPSRVEAMAKRQLPHLLPLQQLIVTARARDEEVVSQFRGQSLADIVIRYDETPEVVLRRACVWRRFCTIRAHFLSPELSIALQRITACNKSDHLLMVVRDELAGDSDPDVIGRRVGMNHLVCWQRGWYVYRQAGRKLERGQEHGCVLQKRLVLALSPLGADRTGLLQGFRAALLYVESFKDGSDYELKEMMGGRIRSLRMTPEAARGPCWARYLAQLLWSGEDLYLQLDSHMRFVPGWDDKAREELAWCGMHSEKPVLCTYGPGYSLGTPYSEIPKGNVPVSMNCANTFDSDGILLIKARELKAPLPEPTKHYFWGAQFSFSSAEVLCEVPYDPQLQMLFFGEEISMAVRLYTHGWDVYAPKENLFFHLWERDYRRVYWKDNRALFASLLKASQCRLHGLLDGSAPGDGRAWPLPGGLRSSGDAFGLGSHRPLEAYEAESGVRFKGKSLQAPALRGGGDALSEDHFLEPAIQAREAIELSGAVEELSFLSGVPFVADAAVNGAPSYVAHVQGDEMHRFVLWYSSTNQTWIVNSGGVAHGLGQEAVPLIFSEAGVDTPVDASRWHYFDGFMGGWIPSRTMKFREAREEAREDAEAEGSWLDAVASLASPLIPRYQ
ncbi:gnt1 [Symbiodinium microadriaticum]|nr:gnt1 [Symbiodinium microadriaticum]